MTDSKQRNLGNMLSECEGPTDEREKEHEMEKEKEREEEREREHCRGKNYCKRLGNKQAHGATATPRRIGQAE